MIYFAAKVLKCNDFFIGNCFLRVIKKIRVRLQIRQAYLSLAMNYYRDCFKLPTVRIIRLQKQFI